MIYMYIYIYVLVDRFSTELVLGQNENWRVTRRVLLKTTGKPGAEKPLNMVNPEWKLTGLTTEMYLYTVG